MNEILNAHTVQSSQELSLRRFEDSGFGLEVSSLWDLGLRAGKGRHRRCLDRSSRVSDLRDCMKTAV